MQLPRVVEIKGIRVLTTHQIAESYEVKEIQISQNFKNNRQRFTEGKHYISLSGDELRAFKNQLEKIEVVKSRTSHLYLWTEKGALLHAKSLNTDKAWQVYDYLVDFYFRIKEEKAILTSTKPEEKEFLEIDNPIRVFRELMELAECRGIKVQSAPLQGYKSRLKDDKIAIKNNLSMNQVIFELAYELSHAIIHDKCGNMLDKEDWDKYHQRAWRAAFMLIEALSIKVAWGKGN